MEPGKFLLTDRYEEIENSFIKNGWLTIYDREDSSNSDQKFIYCCLVKSSFTKSYLKNYRWGIDPGSEGHPSIITSFSNGKSTTSYQTFADKNFEPFIYSKHFTLSDGYDSYFDISEEFVLYYKLYERSESKQVRKYYFIDDLGDLHEVVDITPKKIRIRLKYLKEYIGMRKVNFSICFDFMRISKTSLEEMAIDNRDQDIAGKHFFYNHLIRPINYHSESESQSWIHGKIIIPFDKNTKSYLLRDDDPEYEKFITGYDSNGDEIFQDCSKENGKLLTLTYFKKSVLDKYYNEPNKYKVDGWRISSNFFSLKIDNNIEDYVAVFLVELGHLPHKEQLHWKQFNIAPQKGMSNAYYQTMIEGNWADHPETPDLYFKHKYELFNKNWEDKFGWKFYKDLSNKDEHIYASLHIPTTNNVKSFCDQILSLCKITIDRLNEKEIQKGLELEKGDRSLKKLEKFIKQQGFAIPEMMEFLRNLYNLRSGLLAHSFSQTNKDCASAIKYFNLKNDNYREVAREIFVKSIYTLNTLERKFLSDASL